mmetsp:Transcript_1299/g.1989  ORF Transcript_1299/g.1989 Transcript_1299/m.1989 type:complete len:224 (+) Transcript_1299:135-806(+)
MEPPLQSATRVYPNNAINDPSIPNTHWTAEIALPISKLMERNTLAKRPAAGVFWRVNFSRVQWGFKLNAGNGQYEKDPCCQSCATPGSAAEDNWVWSKQGEVAMHLPERWGIVQFEESTTTRSSERAKIYYGEWPCRCAAMAIYYAMKGYHEKEGEYTSDIEALTPFSKPPFRISEEASMSISLAAGGYEARATIASFTATVNEERYLVIASQKYSTSQTKCE